MDPCIWMAESLCCSPDTITTLLIGYVWWFSGVQLFVTPWTEIIALGFREFSVAHKEFEILFCHTSWWKYDSLLKSEVKEVSLVCKSCGLYGTSYLSLTRTSTMHAKSCGCLVIKLCLTLCNPMDCSQTGFSVHGIFQAIIVEWVAISSSRGSFWLYLIGYTSIESKIF